MHHLKTRILNKIFSTLPAKPNKTILANSKIRKLTPLECERLQCIPDNFTEGFSMSSRYKMVGNGFTVSVVQHILSGMNSNKRRR